MAEGDKLEIFPVGTVHGSDEHTNAQGLLFFEIKNTKLVIDNYEEH